jgi:AraC-like DNA-binding protein
MDVALPPWGIHIESHRHGPGFRTIRHRHLWASLIYVVAGEGECVREERVCALRADTAIVLAPEESHQLIDRPRSPMVVFVVYFRAADDPMRREVVEPLLADRSALALSPAHARAVRGLLRQMLYEQSARPPHFRIALAAGLTSVLLQLRRAARAPERGDFRSLSSVQRVEAVLEFVAGHHYDHHSLAEAARMAHLSQRQFSNICRRVRGQSYITFVNGVRVERARELLASSEMSVSAVAFEVGFEELSTFYRAFRKVHGVAPSRLRTSGG